MTQDVSQAHNKHAGSTAEDSNGATEALLAAAVKTACNGVAGPDNAGSPPTSTRTEELLQHLIDLQRAQALETSKRLEENVKLERLQRRQSNRDRTTSSVAEALGVVCALLASTMLSSLVYPPDLVYDPPSTAACYAPDMAACKAWQAVYGVSASVAFVLVMVALLMTVEVFMGRTSWLHRALVIFFTGVQMSSVTIIASFWLSSPMDLAIFSIVCMVAFILTTMVLLPSVLTWTYYHVPVVGGRAMMLRKLQSEQYNGTLLESVRESVQDSVSSLHLVMYVLLQNDDSSPNSKAGGGGGEGVGGARGSGSSAAASGGEGSAVVAAGGGADRSMARRSPGLFGRLARFSFDSWLRLLVLAEEEVGQHGPQTPVVPSLLLVAFMGDARWAQIMLNSGADADCEYVDNGTVYFPLFVAAREGHLPALEVLLRYDADPNKVDGNGQTALHSGAWGGSLECCQALLRAGADPKAIDTVGRTPLHWAAERGHKAVAELLLAAGSEVDAVDANGRTPLHLAANVGHSTVVEVLLKAGASPNTKASDGWIPLHAAASGGDIATVQALLGAGANVNAGSSTGATPLVEAAEQGHIQVCQALLVAGANPNSGYSGWSPLHAAAVGGNAGVVGVLLRAGANPRLHKGWTALHVGAWGGNSTVVEALLEAGADPNKGDEDGRTALHAAAWGANLQVLNVLLQAGADPCAIDSYGRTPLDEAIAGDYKEVEQALQGACREERKQLAAAKAAAEAKAAAGEPRAPPDGRGPQPPNALGTSGAWQLGAGRGAAPCSASDRRLGMRGAGLGGGDAPRGPPPALGLLRRRPAVPHSMRAAALGLAAARAQRRVASPSF